MRDIPKNAIHLYLALTLAFSSVFWALIIRSRHLSSRLLPHRTTAQVSNKDLQVI
jgi:hypothetical protein